MVSHLADFFSFGMTDNNSSDNNANSNATNTVHEGAEGNAVGSSGGGLISSLLRAGGAVAGIGGITAAVLLVIYRDLIGSRIFPTVDTDYAAILVGLIIVFTFFVTVIGIFVWLVRSENQRIAERAVWFVVLVATLLGALLITLFVFFPPIGVGEMENHSIGLIAQGVSAMAEGRTQDAERLFIQARDENPDSPEPHSRLAQLALRQGNTAAAIRHATRARERDRSQLRANVAWLIALVVSAAPRAEITMAMDAVRATVPTLDDWLSCLGRKGLLTRDLVTETEVRRDCPPPSESTADVG